MNWLSNILNKIRNRISATETQPPAEEAPTLAETPPEHAEDLSGLKMQELRGIAASRDLGDGRYKGLSRAQLTDLIKKGSS